MKKYREYFYLAAACLLAFVWGMKYPFLTCRDDWAYVTGNPHLVLSWTHFFRMAAEPVLGLPTPLPQVSYFLDFIIGGKNPAVYHLINIFWHIAAVWVVFRFFREMRFRRKTAFFAALIFAVHPQRVESVVWIAERKDVMCTFFFMLSCTLYLRSIRLHRPYPWGSLAAMIPALGCKPYALALPGVLFLLDYHRTHKFHPKAITGHLIAAAGYSVLVHTLLQNTSAGIRNDGIHPFLAVRNFCVYFLKTFCPGELYPVYPFVNFSRQTWFMLGLMGAGLAVYCFRRTRQAQYVLLPLLCAAGLVLAPASGLITFSNADFADRYSYVPSVFFLAAAGLILPDIPEKYRRYRWIYPAVLLLLTWTYLPNWNGDEVMLAKSCSAPAYNYRAAAPYAGILAEQGKASEGLTVLQSCGRNDPRTLREMIFLRTAEKNIELLTRYQAGGRGELIPEFGQLLGSEVSRKRIQRVDYYGLWFSMQAYADCALQAHDTGLAARIYDTLAQDYAHEIFFASFYHGVAAMLKKDYRTAEGFFERAVQIRPENENAQRNLESARNRIQDKMR